MLQKPSELSQKSTTRRHLLINGGATAALMMLPTASARAVPSAPFDMRIGERRSLIEPAGLGTRIIAGASSDLLSSLVKDSLGAVGLWPGRGSTPSSARVIDTHRTKVAELRGAGFQVAELHSGHPGSGTIEPGATLEELFREGFEMSEAIGSNQRYRTTHATAHGKDLCNFGFMPPDIVAMFVAFRALSHASFSASQIMAFALPIHPIEAPIYDRSGNHTRPLRGMPACGGETRWACSGFGADGQTPTVELNLFDGYGRQRIALSIHHTGRGGKWEFTRRA